MKLRLTVAAVLLFAGVATIRGSVVAQAAGCPSGGGTLNPEGISAGILCPDGGVGSGTRQTDTDQGGAQANTGSTGNSGSGERNHYRWTRDWLDGDYGP